jgi:hypothetical protein
MRKRNILPLFLILTIITVSPPTASATWDSSAKVSSWVKYNAKLHIDVTLTAINLVLFELNYDATITMEITSINITSVNFTVTEINGSLSSVLEDMGWEVGKNPAIPSGMILLPQEIIRNDSISIGSLTLELQEGIEMDFTKYWRGIPYKKATMNESVASTLFGSGSGFPIKSVMVKYDNATGWLYQYRINIDPSFIFSMLSALSFIGSLLSDPSIANSSLYLDISMADSSTGIETALFTNRDESLVSGFAIQDFASSPWFLVIILSSGIAAFVVVIFFIKAMEKRKVTKTITKTPAKKPIKKGLKKSASKYRNKVKT